MRRQRIFLSLTSIPDIVCLWCIYYYEQKETFEPTTEYYLDDNNQFMSRNHLSYNVLSIILGTNIIYSDQETDSQFIWEIRFGHFHHLYAPVQVGIMQIPLNATDHNAYYGVNEKGNLIWDHGEVPTDHIDYPPNNFNTWKQRLKQGDVISIKLEFVQAKGHIEINKNEQLAIIYPNINATCNYKLFIKMKNLGTKCKIQNYKSISLK